MNFRHLLEEYKLQKQFFEVVNEQLEAKGFLMKEGTIADATIIAAPGGDMTRGYCASMAKKTSKMTKKSQKTTTPT